jgi:predicted dinucleotide-binding enzyme
MDRRSIMSYAIVGSAKIGQALADAFQDLFKKEQ